MISIGNYVLCSPVALAPMAGVTDLPFRRLCRRFGAGLAVAEMLTSDSALWGSRKSQLRMDHTGEPGPISVQIAGGEPAMLAEAARLIVERGAQIIDINMGCPAKKVCNRAAGSALLRDEALVASILAAVVAAVPASVPVTLKIRTGWAPDQRNGVRIARLAEDSGIRSLAVHGRTRACGFGGNAEYDTIAAIAAAVSIPVFANGDIESPEQAKAVLVYTGADGVMSGRAAQGRPWLCGQIGDYLRDGRYRPAPAGAELHAILAQHLAALHEFYGETMGVRIARKHVGWYLAGRAGGGDFRRQFNQLDSAAAQRQALQHFFEHTMAEEELAA